MKWIVPLSDVTIDESEVEAVAAVLRSGWLTQASIVEAFEKEFARMIGARHAVAVTNGTAALHLAYAVAGLKPDDEFILPALTFVATMNAGIYLGAKPVLADCVSADDLTLSPDDVARKITPRTRLIVPMAYGGYCPDMDALKAISEDKGIPIAEDACHAPLADLGGRCIGTFGIAGAFSFFSNKNMTTGEGGMVVTDDDEANARLRRLRSHGMSTLTWDRHRGHAADYDVTEPGFNYRLDEIRAAVGLEQLKKLSEATARRRQSTRVLRRAIEGLEIPGLQIPFSDRRGNSSCHLFVILLPPSVDRGEFRRKMAEQAVQTSVHYPPLHRFTVSRQVFGEGAEHALPVLDSLADRIVTLPMGPHLDAEKIALIAESVRQAVGL